MGEFDGRVVFITGAAGDGIGQATARRLASEGAAVAVTDIHAQRTHKVAESMQKEYGDRVAGYPMDVTDHARVDEVLTEVSRELGPIDVLISNAGISVLAPFSEFDPAAFDRVTAVNYTAPFYLTRRVLPGMLERKSGSIVYVTSMAAFFHARGGAVPYSSAAAAVHGMVRAAAYEGGPHGVRANAVAPGIISSKFVDKYRDKPGLRGTGEFLPLVETIPLRRFGSSDEVASAIVFLCSEQSSYITGEVLNVSGGALMRP